jgi:hypothetical protein
MHGVVPVGRREGQALRPMDQHTDDTLAPRKNPIMATLFPHPILGELGRPPNDMLPKLIESILSRVIGGLCMWSSW